jgi:hypothetical protein
MGEGADRASCQIRVTLLARQGVLNIRLTSYRSPLPLAGEGVGERAKRFKEEP